MRYIYYNIIDGTYWYNFKNGVSNLITFFNIVWNYRRWDYTNALEMLKFNLIFLRKDLENSDEIEEDLNAKLKDIDRAIEILNNVHTDNYLDNVQFIRKPPKNGEENWFNQNLTDDERDYNRLLVIETRKKEEDEWDELFQILKNGKEFRAGMKSWWS